MSAAIPQGFHIAATAAGIKASGLDLGLIHTDAPAAAAAVFTRNAFPAAPVVVSRNHLRQSGQKARAILVNSGNANAAMGEQGMAAAQTCAATLASRLGCRTEEIFVASTGVIGRPLATGAIVQAIPALLSGAQPDGVESFARAIMTTDTFPKVAAAEFQGVRILGFAKGAGMIHPNMATMLAFIVTDAQLDPALLDRALRRAVDVSFHAVTVDGDTSTNDAVAILANGASGVAPPMEEFTARLIEVCQDLAKSIARDGEGATRFIELTVEGAPSDQDARVIGRTIARSPLVKTAIYGCDPNWGRILCAVGNSGVALESDRMEIYLNDLPLRDGDLAAAKERMRSQEIRIRVVLHSGSGRARVWTCDLTEKYIHINADYTT